MRCQAGIIGIRYKEVCVLMVGLMHVYYSMDFYYLLSFVTHILLFDKLSDLLLYSNLCVICCIAAELLHAYQTVSVWIGKWLHD